MSHQASAYAKALTHLPATGKKMTASQKLLLMVLADYHNTEEHAAWPSLGRLADESLISRRHAITIIQSLVEGGVLTVEHRKDIKRGNKSNLYRFIEIDPSEQTSPGGRVPSDPQSSPPSEAITSPASDPQTSPKPVVNENEPKEEDDIHLSRYRWMQRHEDERKTPRKYRLH